jgi:hypothetical protein
MIRNYSAFGFGRRICPGQNLAEQGLILNCARIAWLCDLAKVRDFATDREITPPEYDYTSGLSAQPYWFPFDLKARSQDRVDLLEMEIEANAKSDPIKQVDGW